jgi:hypothetical protein
VCNHPISAPEKLALSMTKLLSNANHPDIAIGIAIDTRIKKPTGVRKYSLNIAFKKLELKSNI